MSHRATQIIRDEHAALAAMLRSLSMMIDHGPGEQPERFFDVLRAMLFYIDEFPEQRHHPKESDLLFPRLARAAPELMPVIRRLEAEHMQGEGRVRALQHLLLAWELAQFTLREAEERRRLGQLEFHDLLVLARTVLRDPEHGWDVRRRLRASLADALSADADKRARAIDILEQAADALEELFRR